MSSKQSGSTAVDLLRAVERFCNDRLERFCYGGPVEQSCLSLRPGARTTRVNRSRVRRNQESSLNWHPEEALVHERKGQMLITKCIPLACAIGLGLLFVPSRRPALPRLDAPLAVPAARVIPSPPGNAFGEALREAKAWRMQAREAAKQEQEAWEARDPQGAAIADADAWRRGLLARDHGSFLRRARAQARRAAALARTPAEAARAAELLVLLECDAGHHATELRQAQRLVALQHGSYRSLTVLRRAAVCNGRTALARQTSAALEALETKSDARAGAPAPQDAPDHRDRPSDRR